MKYMNTVELNK